MASFSDAANQARLEIVAVDSDFDRWLRDLVDSYLGQRRPPRRDVLDTIIAVVRRQDVQKVVVEREYVDADYLESYSRHYSKAFRPKSPLCMRLHFFGCAVTIEDLFRLSDSQRSQYLGYCILRPTGDQYISRTVVSPPHEQGHDTKFVHAAGSFTPHLLGQELRVAGAPFIQQDANTFMCAGAAMWVVAQFMHAEHGMPRYYPAQIGDLARRRISHGQIRSGLTVEQIVTTLRETGCNPYVQQHSNLQELKSRSDALYWYLVTQFVDLIHIFVDSALPPILAYTTDKGGHAVAVVGHNIAECRLGKQEIGDFYDGVLRNSCFVEQFYVMDDARGPYAPLYIDGPGPSLTECDSIAVIAPTPPEASVEYLDAQNESQIYIEDWNAIIANDAIVSELFPGSGYAWSRHKIVYSADDPIVLRTALLDSRAWKLQVLRSELPEWLKTRYQALLLPKYVWVIEFGDFSQVNQPRRDSRRIFGEVVLDATANPHCAGDSLITFHAKGLLLDSSRPEPCIVTAPEPFEDYPPLRRSI